MQKRKNQIHERIEHKIASGLIGFVTGGFLGWYFGRYIDSLINPSVNMFTIIFSVLLGILGLLLDLKKPILTETISFVISIFVFSQILWDMSVGDINKWKLIIGLIALGLFLLNIFTGYLRIKTAKKIIKRQFGMRA
jgi:hypothetical protein